MAEHKVYKVKDYKVPKEWKKHAYMDKDAYAGALRARASRSPTSSGARRASASTGSSPTPRSRTRPSPIPTCRSNGTRTAPSTSAPTASTGISRSAATRRPSSGSRDDPNGRSAPHHLSRAHARSAIFANVLNAHGVKRGDRVTIYMPMIPEAAFAMLACARIGAVHSVVFGGFSPDSLAGRINDCKSDVVITADEGLRGGRKIPLKANADEALQPSDRSVKTVIVVAPHRGRGAMDPTAATVWLHDELAQGPDADCPPEEMGAEDPLFILYTSGSTGKPKGVLHTSGGYLVFAAMTHQYVFDYHDGDIYWCTADVGWVTGHTYIVYGPLANGATTLMFEGVPTYPDASRFWQVVDKHKVNIFYTAPTAIRVADGHGRRPCEAHRAGSRCSCSAPWASRSTRKPGSGTTTWSARSAARSSIRGGRPRPAASSSRRCPARPSSSRARRRCPSSACSRPSSTPRATCSRARRRAISSSSTPGPA